MNLYEFIRTNLYKFILAFFVDEKNVVPPRRGFGGTMGSLNPQ
jgi:hypothetical protein